MADVIVGLLLDEGKWLLASMVLAAVVVLLWRLLDDAALPARGRILAAMNLFYGVVIGTMAFGHLLAVTMKMVQGTLAGSLLLLYPLGLVFGLPAWWLSARAVRYVREENRSGRRLAALNGWLLVALLGLGLPNLPLAAPAALNLAYQFHTAGAVGWAIVTIAVAGNAALFVGSLVFALSGQSFEQFRGMP